MQTYDNEAFEELSDDQIKTKKLEQWMGWQNVLATEGLNQKAINHKNAYDRLSKEEKKRKGLVK